VIKACWNWATLYDLLGDTPKVSKVVLSNPAKNRIIADAQIKNDRVDAKALTTLLRGNFGSTVHVPGKEVRQEKNPGRQRLWETLVRLDNEVRSQQSSNKSRRRVSYWI
jgi:transposase